MVALRHLSQRLKISVRNVSKVVNAVLSPEIFLANVPIAVAAHLFW